MQPPLGIFGIHNSTINLVIDLLVLFLAVVWLALIYWTYADARRRVADPMLVGCATAAALFPYVGTLVYTIVRPPEYLEDVRERELEIQAAEARLADLGYHLCPHCDAEVERDFLRCPNCMRKLKDPCAACGRPLDPRWRICPYCESEAGGLTQARRTRRRPEPGTEPALRRELAGEGTPPPRREPLAEGAARREPLADGARRRDPLAEGAGRREPLGEPTRRELAVDPLAGPAGGPSAPRPARAARPPAARPSGPRP
jgi:hypothetical protein